MHQPLTAGGVALPADPIDAMIYLARLGFHPFPAAPGAKTPYPGLRSWLPFLSEPDYGLLESFRRLPKIPNVGLICDEHFVVIDIDNLTFGAWFEAQGPERLGTWVVQTPSGGLHVYVRSAEPIATTVLKTPDGLKVGDLKARGGYVIAPPSVGSNGDYDTVYGEPACILEVDNAREWFLQTFILKYSGTLPVRLDAVSHNGVASDEYTDTRVQAPPPQEEQDALASELRTARLRRDLHEYVYVTLIEGTHDHWKNADDHSEVDYGCIKDLIRLGWTFQQIEQWWSFAPIGEHRYRGKDKSRGHGYLLRTFDKAKASVDAEQIQISNLQFANALVVANTVECWQNGKETFYRFKLQSTVFSNRRPDHVELRSVDFVTPHAFRVACLKCNVQIELGNFDTAAKLGNFFDGIKNVAREIPLPESVTNDGMARESLRAFVHLACSPQTFSAMPEQFVRAWLLNGFVYVRPAWLRKHTLTQREIQAMPAMWEAWQSIGGTEATLWGETLWRAPVSAFPGLS